MQQITMTLSNMNFILFFVFVFVFVWVGGCDIGIINNICVIYFLCLRMSFLLYFILFERL